MARFDGYPPDYAPDLEYWLRTADEGGPLRKPAELRGKLAHLDRRECLVLVHGFNNNGAEAARAYLGFRNSERAWFADLTPERLEARLGDTYWPGDADWPGPLDWLDFLVYPFAVGTAKDAGGVLADAIDNLALERADFIGHSLGCRVVLEALAQLDAHGLTPIGRVCLMAPAVPDEMVEPGGRFEALLHALVAQGVQIKVLHSASDTVLRFAFPPGQAAAGEPSARALGLNGPPADMPGRGAYVTGEQIANAKHGDYWGHSGTEAARRATLAAGTFLELGERPRSIAGRDLGAGREPGSSREVGRARSAG